MKYAKEAYSYLKNNTDWTDNAISALLGNFEAESGIEPVRLQGDFDVSRERSKEYVSKVDSGKLGKTEFSKDAKGFGLVQWTYHTRKAELYDFCKKHEKSIGDLYAQLDFCISEMPQYPSVNAAMKDSSKSIRQISDLILKYYENPAVQTEAVKVKRAEYGETIHNQCSQLYTVPENNYRERLEEIFTMLRELFDEIERNNSHGM